MNKFECSECGEPCSVIIVEVYDFGDVKRSRYGSNCCGREVYHTDPLDAAITEFFS